MRAMVLAAGLGTRLLPLTARRPKCLMPAGARTLLGLWLERLAGWGVERAVVNSHHLAELVRPRLMRGWPGLEVLESHEPELLGTGGGLVAARAKLGEEPFLLVNADVLATGDLTRLMAALASSQAPAVLGLVDDARFNTVAMGQDGRVLGFKGDAIDRPCRWLTYSGLGAISPTLLDLLPGQGYSSLIIALKAAIAQGEPPLGLDLEGYWDDLGTPERLLALHRDLAQGARPELAHLGPAGPLFLAPGAVVEPGARVQGFAALGTNARIEAGAQVRDCLLLDGAVVEAGARVTSAVLGDGFHARGEISGGAHA